ncbi:hypothetical protein SeLEV6574_g05624 [Synchytrium endobioticum]|nr:hypothetical protein SeLEV6574_g05624 [Synchytrium endobioticum]
MMSSSDPSRRPSLNGIHLSSDAQDDYGNTVTSEAMLSYPMYDSSSITQLTRLAKSHKRRDNMDQVSANSISPSSTTYSDLQYSRLPLPDALRPSFINTTNTPIPGISISPTSSLFSNVTAGMGEPSIRGMGMPGRALRRPSLDTYQEGLYFSNNGPYASSSAANNLDPSDASPRRASDATENDYDHRNEPQHLRPFDNNMLMNGNSHYRKNSSHSTYESSINGSVAATHQFNDWMFEEDEHDPQISESAQPHIVLNTAERRSGMDGVLMRSNTHDSMIGEVQMKQPARVVYYTSHGSRVNFYLQKDESTIGRKEDNTIVLSDAKISKYHASIKKTEIGFFIRDRNSSNGVRVNGTLLDPTKPNLLVHGDVINIGTCVLTFYDVPERAARQPEPDLPLFAFDSLSRSTLTRRQKDPTSTQSYVELVTILPSDKKYEKTFTIREEVQMEPAASLDFAPVASISDTSVLSEDYEKLRLAYELSKISVTEDITELLEKSLELMFEILTVDRGVVLLVDRATGILATHLVKIRPGTDREVREIMLSSTILRKVLTSRIALITTDATEDPNLQRSASVRKGSIRSVICMPLIAHNKIHGILHLDAVDKINYFSNKDLSLVKAICNQTAVAIENGILVKEVQNKARLTENLSRFLSPHVVMKMTERDGLHSIRRGGGREVMGTILFVDIRGFTNISEKSPAADVVELLNEYFERLVKVVFTYDGVVDKYIGDALMATFGTLQGETDAEFRAVCAALDFRRTIAELNMERKRQNKTPIVIGVGVNTGTCLAGFIGSAQRLEYTVIGDNVNISSRLCSMAGENQVLISESTHEAVRGRVESHELGKKKLKGKVTEINVYEVLTARAGVGASRTHK